MQPIDPSRFTYSLAGRLMVQSWTLDALKSVLRPSALEPQLRIPKLADRILAAFPTKPGFHELAAFLHADAGLLRALVRGTPSALLIPVRRLPPASTMGKPPTPLQGLNIPKLPTELSLADWFGMDVQHLRWRADFSGRNRKHRNGRLRNYRYRWIPRKEGFPRLLEIPKVPLKDMQRKILGEILDAIPAHPAAHGFCAGRSIVTNAAVHCGKQAVLRFDLADFFASVSSARIFRIFRTIGYPADVARLLMGICTTAVPADVWESRPGGRASADFLIRQRFITHHLPQGAPTSPALANLATGRLDRRLASLAQAMGADFTRYADDLTFSGTAELARSRKRLATLVAVIADDEGFAVNHRKTRLMRQGVSQHVAGVVVNVRPNIQRAEFDRLKAILTNCIRSGPSAQNRFQHPDFRAYLAGKISHVRSVHPARGERLLGLFRRIIWTDATSSDAGL